MRIAVSLLGIATTGLLVASCNPPPLKVPAKAAEQACHCTQGNTTASTTGTTDTGSTDTASGTGATAAKSHHVASAETHAHHKAVAMADSEGDESWDEDNSESAAPVQHYARHARRSYAGTNNSTGDTGYSSNRSYGSRSYSSHAPASGYMTYDEFVRRGDNIGSSGYSGTHRYMPSYSPPSSYREHSSYNSAPGYSDHSSYDDRSSYSTHSYAPPPAASDRGWYSEHSYASATPPADNGPAYAGDGYNDRAGFRFKRKWHDASVSSYSYRSSSRVYQYGDDGYAGDGYGNEGGWRDGYGRWHARTQLTPRQLDARMDPWHGYDADCPDDQYYGYDR